MTCHESCKHCDCKDHDGIPGDFPCPQCGAYFCCQGCQSDHTMIVHDGYAERKATVLRGIISRICNES